MTSGTDENKELLKSLNEVMLESYSFLAEQDICVLQPDNVSRFLEDGKGEFKLKSADGGIRAEGTYKVNRDEELGTGKPELAFLSISIRMVLTNYYISFILSLHSFVNPLPER